MIDLGVNDDQRQMVEGAVALLAEHAPVARLRPSGKPVDPHRAIAEWGWFGVGLPEARGGLGLGVAEEMLLAFEAGRHLLSPSVAATTLAAHLAPEDVLAALLTGEARAALALATGRDVLAFDVEGASLIAVVDGEEVWLAQVSAFRGTTVSGFDEAVYASRGTVDRASRLASEPAFRARLLIAASLAGIARATCDLAVAYAKVREQFGQPIGAFQAVKHICADMGVRAYAAEAQVRMAAAACADTPDAGAFQIGAAALTALRAARTNAEDAIQVHGGIGFTAECEAHFYLKRAHLLGQLLGGTDACRTRILAERAPEVA
ncbi:MAG: acyl-CoA/acyl-ACP dehydrogenase [Rhizobiaceae bacterium]|nr:acyl-CoA/acyl-ACP dehydrogenase [Rhizobiaceae bacterium]